MKKMLFASANAHKVSEMRTLLSPLGIELLGLKDLGFDVEIPENGISLRENASIKARFLYKQIGFDCFADDTGLEVEALGGAPGVFSARYAGEPANSERNIEKLLSALKGNSKRAAQFKTVICLIQEGEEYFFEGVVAGSISTTITGESGFGYDPVFIPEGYTLSFAEMPAALKNSISHRAKAVSAMLSWLKLQ
ncbi:MAG: RdgB/HAM1 family non-canonical purine NTP pyrophosphatase [Bacteroidia bacterium]